MDQQSKKQYIDQLQKNLTKTCYSKCSKDMKNRNSCFETCYEKYIKTINTTNSTIKSMAYENNSLIGYKGYPEHSIESLMNITRTLVDTLDSAPFAKQHNSRA